MRAMIARWALGGLVATGTLAAGGVAVTPSHAADEAKLYLVQGLPGRTVDLELDGKLVAESVKPVTVAGPFRVKGGSRTLTVKEGDDTLLQRRMPVKAGSSWDAVAHLPAKGESKPELTVFRNDETALPAGKAALVVAHTARVPPADIRIDGKPLLKNVANGESLAVVVPVKTYRAAIVPAGKSKPVLVGPVELTVKGGALNRVYAVGDPEKKTMNVAVHVIKTGTRGSDRPSQVNTGTGGQAVGATPGIFVNLLR